MWIVSDVKISFLISVNVGTNVIKICLRDAQKPAEATVLAQLLVNHNSSFLRNKHKNKHLLLILIMLKKSL